MITSERSIKGTKVVFGYNVTNHAERRIRKGKVKKAYSSVTVRIKMLSGEKCNSKVLKRCKSLQVAKDFTMTITYDQLLKAGIRPTKAPNPERPRYKKDEIFSLVKVQYYRLEKFAGGKWYVVKSSPFMNDLARLAHYSGHEHRVIATSKKNVKIPQSKYVGYIKRGICIANDSDLLSSQSIMAKAGGRSKKLAKVSTDVRVSQMTRSKK
jgi:hypothetical protein